MIRMRDFDWHWVVIILLGTIRSPERILVIEL